MMPGTYTVYVYMRGYVQQEFELGSITLSGAQTSISNHMYRGGGINITYYSLDSQMPPIFRPWLDNNEIKGKVYNSDTDAYMGELRVWTGSKWIWPRENSEYVTVPYPGWPYRHKLKFNGSVEIDRKGPVDVKNQCDLYDPYDERYDILAGFLFKPGTYRDSDFNTLLGLETGDYYFKVSLSGYVWKYGGADGKWRVYVQKGHQADTAIKLIQGGYIQGTILFKKENIFDHAAWNLTLFVRVYDSEGVNVKTSRYRIPYCTEMFEFTISGLDGYPNYLDDYTVVVYNYVEYWGSYWNPWTGAPNIQFGRDAWYGWGSNVPESRVGLPSGLLMGRDCTIVAGDLVCDAPYNHLGPYSQNVEVIAPNMQLGGGESSVVFELDLMGYLYGQLAAYTWSNELRTISWANVMLSGAAGDFEVHSFDGYYEMFAPPGSDYTLTVEEWPGDVGHMSQTTAVTVPDGGAVGQNFVNLERSDIAIPEFPVALLPTLAALGTSIYLLRRKK
jgi:hypothetical protein